MTNNDQNKPRRKLCILLPLAMLLFFNSCIGLSMDIQMRRDGSGRIIMEYRITRMAETIGRLDGNENWPVIPVGRGDWERTASRNPGLRLASFSSNERGQDTVINVTLDYDGPDTLAAFLDPSGTGISLLRENQSGRLSIIINKPLSSQYNEDLLNLMRQAGGGYSFSISFSALGTCALTVTDGEGNAIPPPAAAEIVPSGNRVSLSIGITDLIAVREGLGVSFSW